MFNPHSPVKNQLSIHNAIHTYNCDFELINKGFSTYLIYDQNEKENSHSIFKDDSKLTEILQNLFYKNINFYNMLTNLTYECIENYKSLEFNTLKNYKPKEIDFGSAFLDLFSLKLGNIYDLASKVEIKTKKIINQFNSIVVEFEKNKIFNDNGNEDTNPNTSLNSSTSTNKNELVTSNQDFLNFKLFSQSYKVFLKLISYLTYDIKRKCRVKFQIFNEIIFSILKSIKDKSELLLYLIKKIDIYNQITIGSQ